MAFFLSACISNLVAQWQFSWGETFKLPKLSKKLCFLESTNYFFVEMTTQCKASSVEDKYIYKFTNVFKKSYLTPISSLTVTFYMIGWCLISQCMMTLFSSRQMSSQDSETHNGVCWGPFNVQTLIYYSKSATRYLTALGLAFVFELLDNN